MNKKVKKAITISVIVILVIVAVIATFFIVKYFINRNKINYVYEEYSDTQDKLDDDNTDNSIDNLMLKIDNESVVGVIKIDKINFEGLIYEGTSLDTLSKGVGHFESSPYLEGNVCLAAHNTNSYWAKLYTLESGDKIEYTSFLGYKEYEVFSISQISETDCTNLENTEENILTLITCVKGQSELRLCVQASEIL